MHTSTNPKDRGRSVRGGLVPDLDVVSLGGSPDTMLDTVQRNVTRTAALLGRLTAATFRCGCLLTLAAGDAPQSPWRVMAWEDAHCTSAAHRAVRAKWEGSNLP